MNSTTAAPYGFFAALCRGRRMRGGQVCFYIMLYALISGCSAKTEILNLHDIIQEQSDRQDQQVQELGTEIEVLNNKLEDQLEMMIDTRGGMSKEFRDIQDNISQLMALTGQIQREVVRLFSQINMQQDQVISSPEPSDLDSVDVIISDVEGADPALAENTYKAAMSQLSRGSLATARRAFESFLVDYPDHRLAPSAHFFLGDVLEQENRLDEAIETFLRIPELYPTADRVPQALYRTGSIYILKENLEEGVRYLDTVVNTYPDSGVADLARELLQELN
jgi:tol-pal system protein YbgF